MKHMFDIDLRKLANLLILRWFWEQIEAWKLFFFYSFKNACATPGLHEIDTSATRPYECILFILIFHSFRVLEFLYIDSGTNESNPSHTLPVDGPMNLMK